MINILRDNKGNMYRIETCKYCTDYKGRPKPILPEDMWGAKNMPYGSFKCLTCQTEEIQDMIVKVTLNSVRVREILEERKHKEEKEKQWKELHSMVMKTYGKL